MIWGMKNRLSRIINPKTKKCVMLAVDHGYFLGPTSGLEEPAPMIEKLVKFADSLMLTRGVLRNCVNPANNIPIVLRASGGNSIVGEDLSKEGLTVSVEDALRLNVSAMALSVYVGSKYEHQTILNLAELVNQGEKFGIPILAVTAVGKEMTRDARYLSLACRIAVETGAHMVKTYYCDDFKKVIKSCPVPIVIAGGKKISEKDALNLAHDAIKEGACGVDMGRNIFQSDAPLGMIKAVRAIVHENVSVKNAYAIYKKG